MSSFPLSTGNLSHPSGAHRLVILCHGYKSSHRQKALAVIADDLFQKDYAVYTFDFSVSNPADIEAQVNIVKQIYMHFLPQYDHISLVAASFGALVASIAAAELSDLSGLITINGFFGLPHIGRKYMATYWLFILLTALQPRSRTIFRYYKTHFQPQHIMAATLVIHSRVDSVVNIRQSRLFYSHLHARKQFKTLDRGNHALSNSQDAKRVARALHIWLQTIS